MSDRPGPAVFTIPPHRAFADALAAGLLARHGRDPATLARGLVLLPTNRAVRAVTEAFVRRTETGGLVLPRLVAVGDISLDERIGAALDGLEDEEEIPAAIDGIERRLWLAKLVRRLPAGSGGPTTAAESVRLAGQLATVLDQLLIEEVSPSRLRDAAPEMLAGHWQKSLEFLRIIIDYWPRQLEELGYSDAAARRNRLLDRIVRRWRDNPPPGFVVAAGIVTTAPAVVRLLRAVSRLDNGMVVLPGLDQEMPEAAWEALIPAGDDPFARPEETHPQYQFRLLLDRMGVGRAEVARWHWGGGRDAPAARSRLVERAMAPAFASGDWQAMSPRARRLSHVRFVETATPAEEAQAIALALREALETPERTAALVTPDRGLARRVAAHLARWGIAIDDSAGQPLSLLPAGTFLIALAEAVAQRFAPVALLALLKHPLTDPQGARPSWLEDVRRLDKLLRGARPAAGLAGITARIERGLADPRLAWLGDEDRARLPVWWGEVRALLAPLEDALASDWTDVAGALALIVDTATALAGEKLWAGQAGRAASELVERLRAHAALIDPVEPRELPALLAQFLAETAVRPAYGRHPRLAIYGLLEARLQRADLMILGGLSEGMWPGLPSPDPWLAPGLRGALGLPGLDRQIGLAAHDFVSALGAPQVIVTRARRDMTAPTVASRFWLRLNAMTGGVPRHPQLAGWAVEIDRPAAFRPAERPAPAPPADLRPRRISVTEVDRLKADPFAFYARAMLRLQRQEPVDRDPSAAERGIVIHDLLEHWLKEDGGRDPEALVARAKAALASWSEHPLVRILWAPRVLRAVEWAAERFVLDRAAGWEPIAAEAKGEAAIGPVTLSGRADRIDRGPGGALGIVDYKTGKPPSHAQVKAGFALQLGLIGWLAEEGAFAGISGRAGRFQYWQLSGGRKDAGKVSDPRTFNGKMVDDLADLSAFCIGHLQVAVGDYLLGERPFTAKLNPQFALYSDYDQLARVEEWLGRGNG